MKNVEEFRTSLKSLITAHGETAARAIVESVFGEDAPVDQLPVSCPICSNAMSQARTVKKSLTLLHCNKCGNEILHYCGVARTVRHRKDHIRGIISTVRCYDNAGGERVFDLRLGYPDKSLEMKSGDRFDLYAHRTNNHSYACFSYKYCVYQ